MTLPEYYNGSNWTLFGTVTSIGITGSTGLGITGSPITSAGTINLTLGSELQALSAFASTGLMARTGSGSYAGRALIGSTGINITNGDGLLGNPTISVSTIDINTNTTGLLAISRLAGYATAPTTTFLKGDSTWSLVDINNNTTGSLLPSRISGYPSNSSLFLNGLGSWTNTLITSSSTYGFTLNNTNSAATATSFYIQNNGVGAAEFGFNNSTNEAYVWSSGTATIKFGTNSTTRARILNSGTFDLLTNDLITTGNINAQTGTLKGNNLAAYNSGSIVVMSPLAMNNNSITGLANPINSQDAATMQYVDNSSGVTAKSILHGYVNTGYTDVVAVGDHFKFNGIAYVRGTNITLDTSSSYNTSTNTSSIGRITLVAGKTYKLTASLNNVVSANYNATRWYNSDNGVALGLTSGAASPISTTDRVPSAGTVAYITTSVTTRVELRITWNSFTQIKGSEDSIGQAWFTVEEV